MIIVSFIGLAFCTANHKHYAKAFFASNFVITFKTVLTAVRTLFIILVIKRLRGTANTFIVYVKTTKLIAFGASLVICTF